MNTTDYTEIQDGGGLPSPTHRTPAPSRQVCNVHCFMIFAICLWSFFTLVSLCMTSKVWIWRYLTNRYEWARGAERNIRGSKNYLLRFIGWCLIPYFRHPELEHLGHTNPQFLRGYVQSYPQALPPVYLERVPPESVDDEYVCAICLDECNADLCILPCKHILHHKCVQCWLQTHDDCPLCKVSVRSSLELATRQIAIQIPEVLENRAEQVPHPHTYSIPPRNSSYDSVWGQTPEGLFLSSASEGVVVAPFSPLPPGAPWALNHTFPQQPPATSNSPRAPLHVQHHDMPSEEGLHTRETIQGQDVRNGVYPNPARNVTYSIPQIPPSSSLSADIVRMDPFPAHLTSGWA